MALITFIPRRRIFSKPIRLGVSIHRLDVGFFAAVLFLRPRQPPFADREFSSLWAIEGASGNGGVSKLTTNGPCRSTGVYRVLGHFSHSWASPVTREIFCGRGRPRGTNSSVLSRREHLWCAAYWRTGMFRCHSLSGRSAFLFFCHLRNLTGHRGRLDGEVPQRNGAPLPEFCTRLTASMVLRGQGGLRLTNRHRIHGLTHSFEMICAPFTSHSSGEFCDLNECKHHQNGLLRLAWNVGRGFMVTGRGVLPA